MVISRFQKVVLGRKVINKTRSTNGGNFLANHVVKFLEDRIKTLKMALFELALIINF